MFKLLSCWFGHQGKYIKYARRVSASWKASKNCFVAEFREALSVLANSLGDDVDSRFKQGPARAEIFHLDDGEVIARIRVVDCDGGRGRKATVTSSFRLSDKMQGGFREALEGAIVSFEVQT